VGRRPKIFLYLNFVPKNRRIAVTNSASPNLRAPARAARGPAQNSSSVAAIAAQKIVKAKFQSGLPSQGYAIKRFHRNVTNVN
jgi:hypothetical protein